MGLYRVRRALADMLVQRVPERLGLLRTRDDMPWLPDPDYVQLVDDIPLDDALVRILVGSGTGTLVRASAAVATADRLWRYDIPVGVVTRDSARLSLEQASIARDQTILAVRECLLVHGELSDAMRVDGLGDEEYGVVAADHAGRATSIGNLEVSVLAAERVIDPAEADIVSATATVHPTDD